MKSLSFTVDEFVVHLFCDDLDARIFLQEAERRGTPIGGPYSVQYHTARTSLGQNHSHVYYKQNQLFALNADGSAHDHSHGIRIPNKVVKGIQTHFPDIQIPQSRIIEATTPEDAAAILAESSRQANADH
jgi:hypothetical protein